MYHQHKRIALLIVADLALFTQKSNFSGKYLIITEIRRKRHIRSSMTYRRQIFLRSVVRTWVQAVFCQKLIGRPTRSAKLTSGFWREAAWTFVLTWIPEKTAFRIVLLHITVALYFFLVLSPTAPGSHLHVYFSFHF